MQEPADAKTANETIELPREEGEEFPSSESTSDFLLDRLLYKGVLPRYAFPTDVACFYVFDQANFKRSHPAFRFSPSQGLPVALSQYAPGKQVWIAGKVYTSGAVYSPMKRDFAEMWQRKKLYAECKVCGYAKTLDYDENLRGNQGDCEACKNKQTFGPARTWLRPPGFAHPVDIEEGTSPEDQPERSYATRAKLDNPSPSAHEGWTKLNDRLRVLGMRRHLIVTNSGPRKEGYSLCTICGRVDATAFSEIRVHGSHPKPYPDEKEQICMGERTARSVVFGTDFITDILLISLRVASPMTLKPGITSTHVVLRTLSEAIGKAACNYLELESGEIMSEYRPALTEYGWKGLEAEIFLYDTLPGGAGFSSNLDKLGLQLFHEALKILEDCPENCEKSCYRCLRSYKNKLEHGLLDRHLAANLLQYVLTGKNEAFNDGRLQSAASLLLNDLQRQVGDRVRVVYNEKISFPGFEDINVPFLLVTENGNRFILDIANPLTPNNPENNALIDLMEFSPTTPVIIVDELTIRSSLPFATIGLLKRIGIE